jgi:myo-inositol-1(or 4)-monophosphatase
MACATRPEDAVLAEESGSREGSTNVRWIVDPLDGTVNYYYGIPALRVCRSGWPGRASSCGG